jgi:two-component system, response regulator
VSVQNAPVLIIEDADADYEAITRAFAAADPNQELVRERSTEGGIARLEASRAARTVMPAFALVDLNLPGRSGLIFVLQLKNDPRFCALPLVVLTSSTNPRDAVDSYRSGANSFIVKPFELREFVTAIALVLAYWTTVVQLPPPYVFFDPPPPIDSLP